MDARFDPWKEQGVPLIARFELNGYNTKSAYKIESKRPYFVYYDRGFMAIQSPPVYVAEDRSQKRRGKVIGLLNVDEIPSQKASSLKAYLAPLDSNYRIILPGFIVRNQDSPDQPAKTVNNQAEFDLGMIVRLAHKTDNSLVIAVQVERQ